MMGAGLWEPPMFIRVVVSLKYKTTNSESSDLQKNLRNELMRILYITIYGKPFEVEFLNTFCFFISIIAVLGTREGTVFDHYFVLKISSN